MSTGGPAAAFRSRWPCATGWCATAHRFARASDARWILAEKGSRLPPRSNYPTACRRTCWWTGRHCLTRTARYGFRFTGGSCGRRPTRRRCGYKLTNFAPASPTLPDTFAHRPPIQDLREPSISVDLTAGTCQSRERLPSRGHRERLRPAPVRPGYGEPSPSTSRRYQNLALFWETTYPRLADW